jgi:RNA polymerase sigma factor (sigma-70 family)
MSVDVTERRFESLYREYYGDLMRYAARRVDSGHEADVVAETFTIAWQHLDQLRDENALPWLYGIARRVLANDRRGRYRRVRLASRLGAEPAGQVGDHAGEVASRLDLLAAIEALSARDRECLQLAEWEQLSPEDAAVVMGCSAVAYKVRLHRARRRLAAALARQDGRPGSSSAEAARPHPHPSSQHS